MAKEVPALQSDLEFDVWKFGHIEVQEVPWGEDGREEGDPELKAIQVSVYSGSLIEEKRYLFARIRLNLSRDKAAQLLAGLATVLSRE